jgi:hypothetical protein
MLANVGFGSKADMTLGHSIKYSEKIGSWFISLGREDPIQTS